MQSRFLFCVLVILIILTVIIRGARAEQPASSRRLPNFRVNSDLVVLPVAVTDRTGRAMLGLTAGDFMVAEDGVPQQVLSVSRWDGPASIGVILDMSGSMRAGIGAAKTAVRILLQENSDQDEAFLITFVNSPRLDVSFAENLEEITNRLLWATPRGATALIDGIYAGLIQIRQAANLRRALVIITDAVDNYSRRSFTEVLSVARESDVQVFAVAIRRDARNWNEQRGQLQLDSLANQTGGHLVIVTRDAELPRGIADVNELMRNQYLVSYRPVTQSSDGKWHRVRVRLQPSSKGSLYRVYSKGGYYAPSRQAK